MEIFNADLLGFQIFRVFHSKYLPAQFEIWNTVFFVWFLIWFLVMIFGVASQLNKYEEMNESIVFRAGKRDLILLGWKLSHVVFRTVS